MKNFSEDYLQSLSNNQQSSDPYLYINPIVENQINLLKQQRFTDSILSTAFVSILTAPLQAITISLQLSVLPHKNQATQDFFKQPQFNPNSKTPAKLNTNLTIQEKRKLEIQIRSQSSQPYNAPVYSGYRETIRSLLQQGWKAFFKGTLFRVGHSTLHLSPILFYDTLLHQQKLYRHPIISVAKFYLMKVAVDIITNCLQIAENRYILQNNIKEFRVYRGIWTFLKKLNNRGDFWKGYKFHFVNNLFDLFFRIPFIIGISAQRLQQLNILAIPYYIGQLLIYPLTTAYRRYICQCGKTPGMIPLRYDSITHALKVIYFEEGIKGLWRGFLLHHATIGIRAAFPLFIRFNSRTSNI